MKNPYPVNLLTPEESRAGGWQAEARDKDGHLISQHAPFESGDDLSEYVRDEIKRGHTITIWPIGGERWKPAKSLSKAKPQGKE